MHRGMKTLWIVGKSRSFIGGPRRLSNTAHPKEGRDSVLSAYTSYGVGATLEVLSFKA